MPERTAQAVGRKTVHLSPFFNRERSGISPRRMGRDVSRSNKRPAKSAAAGAGDAAPKKTGSQVLGTAAAGHRAGGQLCRQTLPQAAQGLPFPTPSSQPHAKGFPTRAGQRGRGAGGPGDGRGASGAGRKLGEGVPLFSVGPLLQESNPNNQLLMGQAGKHFTQTVKVTIKTHDDIPSLKAWHFALENKPN